MEIYKKGISIVPFADTLIQADDYNSSNDISLLEIVMARQSDGMLHPDDDTVKDKVRDLVDNAANNNVETLLKKLVRDKQILDMVAEYVASLESATVNGLPVSIAKFAVSTFNKDNAEVYKDNTDFLILVLKNGSSYQVKLVVRLMKDKINHETDLDQVVMVLDNLDTEDQQVLKTLVGELDGIKDSETVNEETKAQVAALSTKLSVGIKKTGLLDKVLGKKS